MGFAGVLSGALGDFVALGLASQSLVAALGGGKLCSRRLVLCLKLHGVWMMTGTTLIANVVIANCWNRDKIFRSDMIGVLFIIIGAVWFAAFTVDAPDESLEVPATRTSLNPKP